MSARRFRRDRQHRIDREAQRRRRLATQGGFGVAGALGAMVLFAPSAHADTFTVTSLADDNSEGTLREEVDDANDLDGDDTIVFATGLTGTITLTDGYINVNNDSLVIQGPGADQITVDGNDNERIFSLYYFDGPNESVEISGLTLTGGSDDDGGAIAAFAGGWPTRPT